MKREKQLQEQTDSTFSTIGYADTIDNKNSGNPMRVQIRNVDTGQSRWFSTFDKNVVAVMMQAGERSGPWQLTYTEKAAQWRDKETDELRTGVNLTIQTAVLQGQQPPPPPPPPRDEVAPNWLAVKDIKKGQAVPNNPDWVTKLDVTGRSIIRQVAFKGAIDVVAPHAAIAASKPLSGTLAWVNELTDAFEDIILCTYEPTAEEPGPEGPPTDDQFIQQEF
jgi:hypothetical protein